MFSSSLINLFREFGIENSKQLESLLQGEGSGGGWSSERGGGYSPDSFGYRVANLASRSGLKNESSSEAYGIQHYTYIGDERIAEESLKKGLFISRRINFVTDHDFSVESSYIDYDLDDVIGYVSTSSWSFSPDFVRDVFKYRELINDGKLQLLPSKITSSMETGSSIAGAGENIAKDLTELDIHKDVRELAASKAVTSLGNKPLVEKILRHYRQSNQLANTLQMDIPWIEGVDLETLTQFISDNEENIENFQRAYHRALEEAITNYQDLNFTRLSQQVNHDIIQPELARLTRKYKRALSLHRSLSIGGAFVASMPFTIALVDHIAFNKTLQSQDVSSLISGFASGLVATLASNSIHYRNTSAQLQEEKFYVLWKLSTR